jgi:hypothetical protein
MSNLSVTSKSISMFRSTFSTYGVKLKIRMQDNVLYVVGKSDVSIRVITVSFMDRFYK